VEQHRLVVGLALVEIDDAADLVLTVGAADELKLAGGFHLGEPSAQVLLGRIAQRSGRGLGGAVHGRNLSGQAARSSARRVIARARTRRYPALRFLSPSRTDAPAS